MNGPRPRLVLTLAILCGLAAFATPALAGDGDDDADDHDKARELFERGEIRSLAQVLEAVGAKISGDVVEVRLRSDDRRWVYACKIVTPDGRRIVVDVDAATLAIVVPEQRP